MTPVMCRTFMVLALMCAAVGCRIHDGGAASSPRGTKTALDSQSKSIVLMRLVGQWGPLAQSRWAMQVERDDFVGPVEHGTTDTAGRASMEWFSGTAHVQVWRAGEDQPALEGIVPLAGGPSPASIIDVGDLRMSEAPALVSGVVCTPDGAPVSGATVSVHRWVEATCALTPELTDVRGPSFAYLGPVKRFQAVTDAGGRFAIFGTSRLSGLTIAATKTGYVQVPGKTFRFLPWEPGTQIVLERAGEVEPH